ncbi:MAG: sensor histidine kinase [Vulcanococcus sp.]
MSRRVIQLADGSRHPLLVSQDVTASIDQERRVFWLLVIAAGVSSLFTSALLRLVLHRGLSRPLNDFSQLLRNVQAPPVQSDVITVAAQPEELQPIGSAFNELHLRLRKSWERQRTFVDGMAHELRTPITLISGHSQSLLRQPLPSALTRPLTLIHQESERMSILVSDLLDLARQDSGRLSVSRGSIDLEILLVETYERLAEQSLGRLRVTLPEDPDELRGLRASGDYRRLQQCLLALVDNALKYSPAASPVTLRCSRGTDNTVVVHVCDCGLGVNAEERQTIFDRFVRGSAALNIPIRGSGIGLALVRELMDAMQGKVRVEERPGGGADFQLHLPAVMD